MPTDPKCATASCCASVKSPRVTESRAKEYACCFKALADPMRIRILNLLVGQGCYAELAA